MQTNPTVANQSSTSCQNKKCMCSSSDLKKTPKEVVSALNKAMSSLFYAMSSNSGLEIQPDTQTYECLEDIRDAMVKHYF